MKKIFFQDARNDADEWQGLLLSVTDENKPTLRLQSALGGRTKLSTEQQTLFWAKIQSGYSGVDLWRTLPVSQDIKLIPHIHSSDIQVQQHFSPLERRQYWAKWFVRALAESPLSPLYNGLWALEYSDTSENCTYDPHRGLLRHWSNLKENPSETSEFLSADILDIDWAMCGNGSIINLFAPPTDMKHSGRLKWWRKVARDDGKLPPLLLWYVSSLDAFILLDGHDRLYASLLSNVQPEFLILNSYTERAQVLDEQKQQGVLKQMAIIEQKIADGVEINPDTLLSIQKHLIYLYDDRPVRIERTRAIANLSEGQWDKEVKAFIQKIQRRQPHAQLEPFWVQDV